MPGAAAARLFPLYLGQTALLGLAGSAGRDRLLGVAVQLTLPRIFSDLIQPEADPPLAAGGPAARSAASGIGVALLFSLAPLSAVLRVPPARVLRRDAEPLPLHRWVTAATLTVLLAFGVWVHGERCRPTRCGPGPPASPAACVGGDRWRWRWGGPT